MGQAKKRGTKAARAVKAAEKKVTAVAPPGPGVKGLPGPQVTQVPEAPWDPDGALTHLDLQNILTFTGNIPVSGDAVDLLGRLRSKLKKNLGHAAVFVPADVAKLVGVDVLQSAMAGEAEALFLAGVAEDDEKDNAAGS